MENQSATLNIYDQTGRILHSLTVTSSYSIILSGSEIKPGIYFIRLETSNGLSATEKIIRL
ncbi:MAG: T9SS type A sorting domain-containing protein [Bacteroidales bacterium]|nr:T9SS type A sorting domain-containing protein [Bacteroidales bacterium]